jgi:hypothetical protein
MRRYSASAHGLELLFPASQYLYRHIVASTEGLLAIFANIPKKAH